MGTKIDTRVYTINDVYKWYKDGELDYSPKYQRNSVWNNSAKSFLIDTVLKSFSVPPIFMRQTININTKTTRREVVDGQQRIRSIIDFLEDKFKIIKSQNVDNGNKFFSTLGDEAKKTILEYQLVFILVNIEDDNEIYDLFFRLNTNNYVLNKQEIRNAKYWGEYKVTILNFSAKYRGFFISQGIFNDKQVARMADVEYAAMLVNVFLNGVQTENPKDIDNCYEKYNDDFSIYNTFKNQIHYIMDLTIDYMNFTKEHYCFKSKSYYYTLFAALSCMTKKLNDKIIKSISRKNIPKKISINRLYSILKKFEEDYNDCVKNNNIENKYYRTMDEFSKLHMTRTTNKKERIERINILINYLLKEYEKA